MRLHQIIFLGLVAVAFITGLMKSPRKVIGGVIGALLGFFVPFLLAQVYVKRGGDPTAAGAFSFLTLVTIPVGIIIGVAVASLTRKE